MTTPGGLRRAALVLAVLACCQGVSAQNLPAVGAVPSPRSPVTVAGSLLASLESVRGDMADVPPEQGRLSLSLGYNRPSRRSNFEIVGSSIVPAYASGIHRDRLSFAAGLQLSRILGRRTQFSASASGSERPFDVSGFSARSGTGVFDATTGLLTSNGGLTTERELRYDGAMTLSRILSRTSWVDLTFTHTGSIRPGVEAATSQIAGARIARRISPSSVIHAGYGFGVASFATVDRAAGRRHDVDLGVSFERPLPFSGRTLFSASTGSTVLTDGRTHQFRLLASASLSRDLGHAWSSAIAYSRPMQYVAGFEQPFLSDALSLKLEGRVARVWFLSFRSALARGSVALAADGSSYESYSASVSVRRQIGRAWRVEAEAFAMQFTSVAGDTPSAGLPPSEQRHGVRAGISWSTEQQR